MLKTGLWSTRVKTNFKEKSKRFLVESISALTQTMGRRGRKPRRQIGGRSSENPGENRRQNYTLAQRENAQFEKYYKMQKIVPEEEWDSFMETLRTNLPTTFRITGHKKEAQELLKKIKSEYFNKLTTIELEDGSKIEATPQCLSWYPDEMAWQLNMDRKFIRHSQHLAKLHQFLIMETESGFISRQEAVSMIPPLVMDIKPHHKILDMCAAPGSKTAQMMEMLHYDDDTNPIPEGVIIANDVDFKRCYLLVHQLQRLASPSFAVINHDASRIPNFKADDQESSKNIIEFDRILADVPCTGDGTMRKNRDVWQKWNPINATNLHGVQKRILRRGVELLATGGRIVYSTCSLNPTEDEAVVAHVLKECQGTVELLDVRSELPGLKFQPGISTWKVMTKQEEVYEKLEDVPERLKTIILPSLFPPDAETAANLHLERCMRVLPHQQNTGGFFIAVMKKVRQVPWQPVRTTLPVSAPSNPVTMDTDAIATETSNEATNDAAESTVESSEQSTEASEPSTEATEQSTEASEQSAEANEQSAEASEETTEEATGTAEQAEVPGSSEGQVKRKAQERAGRNEKKQKYKGNREDPFIYLKSDDSFWPAIRDYYGIKEEFPVDQLMVRCDDGKRRNIYFTNKTIKDMVSINEGRIKFVNLGLKVMARCDSPFSQCDFRLVQDGISAMCQFVTKRIVEIPAEDIVVLLSQENPFCSKFSKEIEAKLNTMDQGGCMFRYTPDGSTEDANKPQCHMVLCGWKAKVSARSFLPKQGRFHYLCLCGQELRSKPQSQNTDTTNGSPADNDDFTAATGGNEEETENTSVLEIRPLTTPQIKPDIDAIKVELKTEIKEEIKVEIGALKEEVTDNL